VGDKIGYARVSTADQDPLLQLDALAAEGCLKVYTDTATGTTADRPEWARCLDDLRPGDTLIIWKIDRLGRNLRDLIEIVTTRPPPALSIRGTTVRATRNVPVTFVSSTSRAWMSMSDAWPWNPAEG